jgi:hypothetical protein
MEEVKRKKMRVSTIALMILTFMIMTGCTVLSSPGQDYDSFDGVSYGGHSHH